MHHVKLNMNGDSGQTLLEELRRAHTAIEAAKEAVGQLTTHGRNYQSYIAPMEHYRSDYDKKLAMVFTLRDMSNYLAECYVNINGQMHDNSTTEGN